MLLTLPGEVAAPATVREGGVRQVTVNACERNQRALSIVHWGLDCVVCGFNFEERYGGAGLHPRASFVAVGIYR